MEAKSLPQIYAAAANDYSAQDYQTALAEYTVLAERNYSDSAKRLFLTNAHLCESLQQLALASDMTNAQAAQKLLDLIGFSDTNQLLMSNAIYDSADEGAVAFYRFSVLNSRMMIADAVGDGRAYTMFRQ